MHSVAFDYASPAKLICMLSWEHTCLPPTYPAKNKNQLWLFNVQSLLYHINSFLQILPQNMENIWENTHK